MSNHLIAAKELQCQDDPVGAAHAYEAAFDEKQGLVLSDYIEAAVLYFVCSDFGYISYKNLPENFARAAYARAKLWLERATRQFGLHAEVEFWGLYFDYVVLGALPFIEECRRLVEQGETSVPYFYMFSSTRDETYRAKAEDLYNTTKKGGTVKQRYISSILAPLLKT